jgi:MerR-like DNA binding protein
MYGIKEAARQAGITEELLGLWLKTGEAEATEELSEISGVGRYLFDESAIKRLRQLAQIRSKSTNPRAEARDSAVEDRETQNTLRPEIKRKKRKHKCSTTHSS